MLTVYRNTKNKEKVAGKGPFLKNNLIKVWLKTIKVENGLTNFKLNQS